MALAYLDLVGVPYHLHGRLPHGLDCSTVLEEVLSRLGIDPLHTSPFRYPNSSGELGEFEGYLSEIQSRLKPMGTNLALATQPGDAVLVSGQACSASRGMYTLVEPGLFLTSHPRSGVTLVPVEVVRRLRQPILGVYRADRSTD